MAANSRISRPTFDRVVAMLGEGGRLRKAIAAECGVSGDVVRAIAKGCHSYQTGKARGTYEPTLEEIEDACQQIRRERADREGPHDDSYNGWTVPVVRSHSSLA